MHWPILPCPPDPNLPGIGFFLISGGIVLGFIGIVLYVIHTSKIGWQIQSKRPGLIPFAATADECSTNNDRASWAEAALLAFAQRTGMAEEMVGDKEDAFFIVSDLLSDMGHWCDRHNVDLPSALVHAAKHYLAETNGTGKQFNS